MSHTLSLVVPADAKYRALGSEVGAKFAEIVGGSSADAEALGSALTTALAEIAAGAPEGDHIDVTLQAGSGGVEITLHCHGRSSVVRQPLPVRKP